MVGTLPGHVGQGITGKPIEVLSTGQLRPMPFGHGNNTWADRGGYNSRHADRTPAILDHHLLALAYLSGGRIRRVNLQAKGAFSFLLMLLVGQTAGDKMVGRPGQQNQGFGRRHGRRLAIKAAIIDGRFIKAGQRVEVQFG